MGSGFWAQFGQWILDPIWAVDTGPKLGSGYYVMLSGKIRIFLSFRFYVKSILEDLEVLKLPFFAILGALDCVN